MTRLLRISTSTATQAVPTRSQVVPFNRPQQPPSKPKRGRKNQAQKNPRPRQPSFGRDNSNTRGRNAPHNRINQNHQPARQTRQGQQGFSPRQPGGSKKNGKKSRGFLDEIKRIDSQDSLTSTKPSSARPSKPLSDGLTNQTGKRIGRRVVQSTGSRAVGTIIRGASVVGTIQTGWDVGTGIGGLGRGLLGIDEVNPYIDMPGFGAAELAWDLGDAINNLISPINNLNDVVDPLNEENEPTPTLTTNTQLETALNSLDIYNPNSPSFSQELPNPLLINPDYANEVFPVVAEYDVIRTVKRWVVASWKFVNGEWVVNELKENYTIDAIRYRWELEIVGLNPKATPRNSNDTSKNLTWFSDYVWGRGYQNVKGWEKRLYTIDSLWPDSNKSFNEEFTRMLYRIDQYRFDSFQELTEVDPNDWYKQIPLEHSPENPNNIKFVNGYYYKPIMLTRALIMRVGSKRLEYLSIEEVTNFSYTVLNFPKDSKPREVKMGTCKALDALKAMEQRINALEAGLNQRLGQEAITKFTITTTDENGQSVETELELDGIGGTVSKILENQYDLKLQTDNEEILKRLGDPITPETQLPSGETLAAAGIGIGGIGGLALLMHGKLGPQVSKLSTYTNTGTATKIIPEITETTVKGLSGGIEKINEDFQKLKDKKDKELKLRLKANLIALIDLALSIHNAFSLSSALIETIVSFMNNVFQMFGLKDDEGNPIDVKEVVGESFETMLQKLLGVETAEDVIMFFKKTNRIIQSASNVLFDLQGLTDSVRSISQQTGEYVAKIGNALRRNRIVPDDKEESYGWMDEKMSPTSAFQKRIESISEELSNVTDFMGSLESVTSEVISAQEQFVSLKNNAIEFKNLVTASEAEKGEKETVDTASSQSPEISLAKPESEEP